MIGVIFQFGLDNVEIRIDKSNVCFRTSQLDSFTTIDGLRLDKSGVIKEFPDLKENKEWQDIARERFKDKMKLLNNEPEILEYIINDLRKFGYIPMYKQISGFRPVKIK